MVKKAETIAIIHENVSHPKHYNSSKSHCECGRRIECIDVVRHMDFNVGNAIKYLWRFEHKNGLEDLKKARWYIDDEIKKRELQEKI
jgi:polyferredoxin